MLSFRSFRNRLSRCLCRQIFALVQVAVMLVLMMPACFDDFAAAEEAGYSVSVGAHGDESPCCPDGGDDHADTCSMCSCCSSYLPLPDTFQVPAYAPSVAQLVPLESLMRLPEVHLPIFIPPRLAA